MLQPQHFYFKFAHQVKFEEKQEVLSQNVKPLFFPRIQFVFLFVFPKSLIFFFHSSFLLAFALSFQQ